MIRSSSLSMWDTIFLPAGTPLAGKQFVYFDTPLGGKRNGRILDIADTNIREGGRVPSSFSVCITRVSSLILAEAGVTPVEKLALSAGEDSSAEIAAHGILQWDFLQTRIEVGPLWLGTASQDLALEGGTTFSLLLRFGSRAPTLTMPHFVRVAVEGTYKNDLGQY